MFVKERFVLDLWRQDNVRKVPVIFGFGQFGEITYYRTYSRMIFENEEFAYQEHWHDTVLRVIQGVMSIRKDYYIKNHIHWNEDYWQQRAHGMAISLARKEWLPPGRGLWAMGTDLIYERGAMALYNCAFTHIDHNWVEDLCWLMDTLMYGVGVGFRPIRSNLTLQQPTSTIHHMIPDTREGWVDALRALLNSFVTGGAWPEFDYSLIRPEGALIRSFGGLASGPEPLKAMLNQISELCYRYSCQLESYDEVTFKTDLANLVGVCVVTGNVRRSAEIALCDIDDRVFRDLKNYEKYPERAAWGWMSNNTVVVETPDDFEQLDTLATANINGHDLGFLNLKAVKYGRVGKTSDWSKYNLRVDQATGLNPCGEIPLEHREVCNLAETLPTRCLDTDGWLDACSHAALYCQTVSLLPTHQSTTNAIVARNRRIGVSLIDVAGWQQQIGPFALTKALRDGYRTVRTEARKLAQEAGVPEPIRCTTVKPGGTVPKIAGRISGWSNPTFQYMIRRIRIQRNTPIEKVMIDAGIPHEPDAYSKMTTTFEVPVYMGEAKPAGEVSLWEQAAMLAKIQREWADNAVSNTLYFKPKWSTIAKANANDLESGVWSPFEEMDIEVKEAYAQKANDWRISADLEYRCLIDYETDALTLQVMNPDHEEGEIASVLAAFAPQLKSVSLLPHSSVGAFAQMPEEGITKEEFERRVETLKEIDFSGYNGSDGQDEKYCQGDTCVVH